MPHSTSNIDNYSSITPSLSLPLPMSPKMVAESNDAAKKAEVEDPSPPLLHHHHHLYHHLIPHVSDALLVNSFVRGGGDIPTLSSSFASHVDDGNGYHPYTRSFSVHQGSHNSIVHHTGRPNDQPHHLPSPSTSNSNQYQPVPHVHLLPWQDADEVAQAYRYLEYIQKKQQQSNEAESDDLLGAHTIPTFDIEGEEDIDAHHSGSLNSTRIYVSSSLSYPDRVEDHHRPLPVSWKSKSFWKSTLSPMRTLRSFWILLCYAIPVSIATLSQFIINPILVAAAGRFGSTYTAGIGPALSAINFTATTLGLGFGGALDTILPQIYGVDPRNPRYTLDTVRIMLFLTLPMIPIMVFYFFLGNLLKLFGVNPDVTAVISDFTHIATLVIPASIQIEQLKRFFLYRHHTFAVMVSIAASLVVLVVIVFSAENSSLGFRALPLGLTVSNYAAVLLLLGYGAVRFRSSFRVVWPWCRKSMYSSEEDPYEGEHLCDRGAFAHGIRLGFAALFGLLTLWSCIELINLLGASLPVKELASLVIALQVNDTMWSVTSGIFFAGIFYTGRHISIFQPRAAQRVFVYSNLLVLLVATVDSIICIALQPSIASIFTSDPVVRHNTRYTLRAAACFHIIEALTTNLASLYRACGHATPSAFFGLVAWPMIGIPINVVLAFTTDVGASSMFIGTSVMGLILLIPLHIGYMIRTFKWKPTRDKSRD